MLPGLPNFAAAAIVFAYQVSAEDSDLYVDMGSPAGSATVVLYVNAGVVLSSSGPSVPALDITSFNTGSHIIVVNRGDIRGAGGAGGNSKSFDGSPAGNYGGGGGGAGIVGGIGGFGHPATASLGADGTEFAGGANGTQTDGRTYIGEATVGGTGGTALLSGDIRLTVYNEGTIWGGGGGAGGNGSFGTITAPTGGAPGAAGDQGSRQSNSAAGGAGGYAVNGTDITFVSGGSSPDVEGDIG